MDIFMPNSWPKERAQYMLKISVIMGVYNTCNADMLNCSINSILTQTESNFEFIICDDGSTDGTYELLTEICKKDNRIILLRNKANMGLAATLNCCIDVAGGEYIAKQDADDYSVSDRIEKQVCFLEGHEEYAFVGSNIALFDDHGQWGEYRLKEFPEKKDFLFTLPIMHSSVMYRKQALASSGKYRVAEETRRAEDYDLFMRMYTKGFRAANIQECLLFYREDKESYKRRKYRYRIDEAKVRYKGYKQLGLMPNGYIYVLKPLIVGLIPNKLLNYLKDRNYKRRSINEKTMRDKHE